MTHTSMYGIITELNLNLIKIAFFFVIKVILKNDVQQYHQILTFWDNYVNMKSKIS